MRTPAKALLSAGLSAAFLIGFTSAQVPAPQSELLETEARDQRNLIPDAEIPVPEPEDPEAGAPPPETAAPPPWATEEAGLWALIRAGQLDGFEAKVAGVAARYPGWSPPPRMLQLADETRRRQAVAGAEGQALVALSGRYPENFSCNEINNLWRLSEAYRELDSRAEAGAVYLRILADCENPEYRFATLQKGADLFASEDYIRLLDDEYLRNPEPALARLRMEVRRGAATQAAQGGDCEASLQLLLPVRNEALETQDVDSGRLFGWCFAATGAMDEAIYWREMVAGWTGADNEMAALAAVLAAAGRQDEALAIAEVLSDRNPEAGRLIADILLGQAAETMTGGDCQGALDLIEAAIVFAAPTADNRRLRAWALYDCGRDAAASDAFASLYFELLDDNAGQGLLLSDYRRRALANTENVARKYGGPLVQRLPAESLPTRRGDVDYNRLILSDDVRISILRRREWASLAGIGWSTRRGDGPSELDTWRLPALEVEYQHDRHHFEFRATRLDLDSGGMSLSDFPVNTPDITGVAITDSESGLWEPVIAWGYEAVGLLWSAELGMTPVEGEVSSTWQGRFGAAERGTEFGWSLAAVRVPVDQSILSWVGVTGALEVNGSILDIPFDWGRVTRNGIDAAGYLKISDDWTLSGDLRFGDYSGHNVESNFGGQFYGLAETRWSGTGESGMWWGPYLYLSGFDKNLGHFAPGHGGYFSPDWLVGAGLAGRWRRDSGSKDPWYLEVRGSGGYQTHEEAASELIPDAGLRQQLLDLTGLNPVDLGGFASNKESGFAGTLEAEGLRRIGSSRWHVGGYVRGRVSPEFNNFATMLVVRYGLEQPRNTVRRQYREQFSLLDR
jgi:tetratricopeptide (TPR) repeat protein